MSIMQIRNCEIVYINERDFKISLYYVFTLVILNVVVSFTYEHRFLFYNNVILLQIFLLFV